MNLFAPRYKRYAAWPVVIWCRLRGHSPGRFWSGTTGRCIDCGDVVYAEDAIPKMQQNIYYWGDRCDRAEAENERLRARNAELIAACLIALDEATWPDEETPSKIAEVVATAGNSLNIQQPIGGAPR